MYCAGDITLNFLHKDRVIKATKDINTIPQSYANLQKRYRNILTWGKKELPIIPPKPSGKRGKLAKSDA